jgi:hypothetical protein
MAHFRTVVGRRRFLSAFAGTAAMTALSGRSVPADDLPPVTNPRATDGDERFEPNWEERLTITVGEKSGDMTGKSDRVIQAALDSVARLGGGTVKVLPGTYTFRNAVWIPSRVRLLGSGTDSVVTRLPSVRTELTLDSDWYDQEVTIKDGSGFQVGDGVVFQATNPHNGAATVIKRTLVAQTQRRPARKSLAFRQANLCVIVSPVHQREHGRRDHREYHARRQSCEL